MDKRTHYKIFTDPIHGFISVPKGIVLKLVDHPYVQRLRRIRQLGLGYLVFPGSEHSRFSHAIGALGLMQRAINSLREKDTTITRAEHEAVLIGILLHDIGHGPFSHTLEQTIIRDFHHEMMTLALMRKLNEEFDGGLSTAIDIFTGQHPKTFLHQLISSQLDMDRLDYLRRDSVYTGVNEGSIGIDRIIKTMRVFQGNVVIEGKGIYAVENYITARRLMYMQVYQHKTVLSGDKLLASIFRRVRDIHTEGGTVPMPSPALGFFLKTYPSAKKGLTSRITENYLRIDDNDVLLSIKCWQDAKDPILADLSNRFLNRRFFRTTFVKKRISANEQNILIEKTRKALKDARLPHDEKSASYYLFFDELVNEAYRYESEGIWILQDHNTAIEFSRASETGNISALTKAVVKPYIVHLKDLVL
ncbi:MAG: HD domain-containing protein [Bacteroidetes bacterium]|nr:HD domain-containing protein [Bacteroidota bacterium]MCH8524415.1 HD domain-containing protein [Balneolales bacterium]